MEGGAAEEDDEDDSGDEGDGDESGSEEVPLSDDEHGGLDEAALAKFASDDEEENDADGGGDSGDDSDGGRGRFIVGRRARGRSGREDGVAAAEGGPRGPRASRHRRRERLPPRRRARQDTRGQQGAPRHSLVHAQGGKAGGRDRSKGAARTRMAERKGEATRRGVKNAQPRERTRTRTRTRTNANERSLSPSRFFSHDIYVMLHTIEITRPSFCRGDRRRSRLFTRACPSGSRRRRRRGEV